MQSTPGPGLDEPIFTRPILNRYAGATKLTCQCELWGTFQTQ
jgi:hypothetical protein